MKKFLSILLAVTMLFSLCIAVSAETGSTEADTKGSIEINNAIEGNTYSIYKVLTLESFNTEKNAYTYTVDEDWKGFFEEQTEYFTVDGNVVTVKEGVTLADDSEEVIAIAEAMLDYAKDEENGITATKTEEADETGTVTFSDLGLGYYLVDSSVGTLLALTTTNADATIEEKNIVPHT